jgi:hypothetical protein
VLKHHLKGQGLVLQGNVLDPETLNSKFPFSLVDPLGEPSTAESSFSWVLFLTIICLAPVRSPKAPPPSLTARERTRPRGPSWISGVTDSPETGPLSPLPSLSDPVPNTDGQGLGGRPKIPKGPSGALGGPHTNRVNKSPGPLNTGIIGASEPRPRLSRCSAPPETLRLGSTNVRW